MPDMSTIRSRLIFFSLCAVFLAISVLSFYSAWSLVNRAFPGFFVYNYARIGSMGSNNWPGAQAGLKLMDQILAADGIRFNQGSDITKYSKSKPIGTGIEYRIKSKGQIRTVVVPTAKFGINDFFNVFSIPFVCGAAIFGLGIIVYILKPNITSSWVFFLFCLFLGVYMVTGVEMQSSYRFYYLNYLSIPLIPATLFHLCSIFPQRKKVLDRNPFLEYSIYLPAVIIICGYFAYLSTFKSSALIQWIVDISIVTRVNRVFYLACLLGSIGFLIHGFTRSESVATRQRAKMILIGITFAFAPAVLLMLAAVFIKTVLPWNFLTFFVVIFPLSITYSIVRHNLFDADLIIRRTVGYFIVTVIVVGAYGLVTVSFNVFMGGYQLAQSRLFPILFTLAAILIFNPLRNWIQGIVDRAFFRKEYDYGAIVEKVGGAMTSLLDLPLILKRLTQTFSEDMFINTSSILLLSPSENKYRISITEGERRQDLEKMTFNRNDPLMEVIREQKRELTKYDVLEDPKFKTVSESCAANMEALHASLIVPLVYQDQVIGSLNLGEKKSGKSYNREDIDLLKALANQGAVAIENAMMLEEIIEKERMEEELSIARDLQISMLPAHTPQIKGFEIAAFSVSAREVGGDFYDFIEMGTEKAGMVIGDVTGKSVSGALVMSSSRSIFRMLSEEELTVGESMTRANQRLKKDVKSGMFVALLYAVIDSQDKILTLCSAGQTQPVHVTAGTGAATLVETRGDTFPLGILEEAAYEETQLKLEAGDKVILYTDGIVEAMNEEEEMFGFDRLLESVKDSQNMTAETLLNEIKIKVNEFAGSATQHDDITIIVIQVTSEEGLAHGARSKK